MRTSPFRSISRSRRMCFRTARPPPPMRRSRHRSTKATCRRTQMAELEYKTLTHEELNALAGVELPERAAMSLINANVAAPINAAIAANVLSDGSVAYANAQQTAPITQSNL